MKVWTDEHGATEIAVPEHRILTPKIGVGIIAVKGGKLLAHKRHKDLPSGGGDWSIPGGKLEFEETVHTCALRELYEETGIEANLTKFFDFSENMFPTEVDHTPMHWITMYLIVPTEAEPRITEPEKCEAVEWMSPVEFSRLENLFLPNRGLLSKDAHAFNKAVDAGMSPSLRRHL